VITMDAVVVEDKKEPAPKAEARQPEPVTAEAEKLPGF
jgi:hypothetical protein